MDSAQYAESQVVATAIHERSHIYVAHEELSLPFQSELRRRDMTVEQLQNEMKAASEAQMVEARQGMAEIRRQCADAARAEVGQIRVGELQLGASTAAVAWAEHTCLYDALRTERASRRALLASLRGDAEAIQAEAMKVKPGDALAAKLVDTLIVKRNKVMAACECPFTRPGMTIRSSPSSVCLAE